MLTHRRRKRQLKPLLKTHLKPQNSTPSIEGVCRCGNDTHPVYFNRCEDCWVDDQIRWDGQSRRVRVMFHV